MNWMALIALHAVLTFAVVVLVSVLKLVVWLATRRRAQLG
jgi:hypothetical protein